MKKNDIRFQPMCCHFLSNSPCDDILLGAVECQSPYGTYELSVPIDVSAPCAASSPEITDANCKDFDVSDIGLHEIDNIHILGIWVQLKNTCRSGFELSCTSEG